MLALSSVNTWILVLYQLCLLQNIFQCNGFHIDTRYVERPGQNLCAKENYYRDVNCTNQIKSKSNSVRSCLMKYINQTSIECSNSQFRGEVDATEEYGSVKIAPFPWFDNGIIFPSLNITFTNISWTRVRMRFVKAGLTTPQICREFVLSGDVDPSSVISFDCLWGSGATAEELYRFQHVLTTGEGRQFLYTHLLQIPKDTDVDENLGRENYRLFLLMDETAFPKISVKLRVPPLKFSVSSTNVTLYYKQDPNSNAEILRQWTLDLTARHEGEVIRLEHFDTDNTPGYYYYNATFSSDYCKNSCLESSTPQLQITGMIYSAKVILAVIFIAMAVLGLVGYLLWKKRYKKLLGESEKPPNVLFVYESSYPSHVENVYKFKEFLENNSYVAPKLDLIDIPRTDSRTPWMWYYNAFKEADYVLVFASPRPENAERGIHEDNIYHNLHSYALNLLHVYLRHKHKFLVAKVKLPGCSWDTMPPETFTIDKKFSLPEKLSHLFKFLNVPPLNDGASRLATALREPRTAPRISVSPPSAPLPLPFDEGSFGVDDDARESLTIRNVVLNLDDPSTSDDDEEDSGSDTSLAGLKF